MPHHSRHRTAHTPQRRCRRFCIVALNSLRSPSPIVAPSGEVRRGERRQRDILFYEFIFISPFTACCLHKWCAYTLCLSIGDFHISSVSYCHSNCKVFQNEIGRNLRSDAIIHEMEPSNSRSHTKMRKTVWCTRAPANERVQ